MRPHRVRRGGTYYRVCDPSWKDPADTTFSKRYGGRWNVAGAFGALYLCATIDVAAANARRSIARAFGDAVTFSDLRREQRPQLQAFLVGETAFVDAVSGDAQTAQCQAIAQALYAKDEAGVAARSAIAPGEELAVFDTHLAVVQRKRGRQSFERWYPGLV